MPKIVDHEARRAQVVDAVWSVVLREGMGAASVRAVAAEAGLSTGAVRHYFDGQDDLLAHSVDALMERAAARVQARIAELDRHPPVEGLMRVLVETLPLDEVRRRETEVWLAMVQASRTDHRFSRPVRTAHEGIAAFCGHAVARLTGWPARQVRTRRAAAQLHALVDGYALHGVLQPDLLPPVEIEAGVRAHLEGLAAQPRG